MKFKSFIDSDIEDFRKLNIGIVKESKDELVCKIVKKYGIKNKKRKREQLWHKIYVVHRNNGLYPWMACRDQITTINRYYMGWKGITPRIHAPSL